MLPKSVYFGTFYVLPINLQAKEGFTKINLQIYDFFICWIIFQFHKLKVRRSRKNKNKNKIYLQNVSCVHLSVGIFSVIDRLWSFMQIASTKYYLMLQYDHYIKLLDKFYFCTFSVMTFILLWSAFSWDWVFPFIFLFWFLKNQNATGNVIQRLKKEKP